MPRKSKNNKEELHGVLRFIRIKSTLEDLVGYVKTEEGTLNIFQPLRVEIETLFDEGRQILSLQEYLPQSIIDIKEIKISMSDVMLISPVRWEFYEQYEFVSDFFYNNKSKIIDQMKKTSSVEQPNELQQVQDDAQKVVSILEALANKKDKPVH